MNEQRNLLAILGPTETSLGLKEPGGGMAQARLTIVEMAHALEDAYINRVSRLHGVGVGERLAQQGARFSSTGRR